MIPGDLVKPGKKWESLGEIPMFSSWGNKVGGDMFIGNFHLHEIGMVLESTETQGGNGVRLLIGGNKIGWVHVNFLEKE